MKRLLLFLAFLPLIVSAQSKKQKKILEAQRKAEQQTMAAITTHAAALADAGQSSADYIAGQLKASGLAPAPNSFFIEDYKVRVGKGIDSSTNLKVNDKELKLNEHYFPLNYSAQKRVTGMPAMALRERGLPWFVDLSTFLDNNNIKDFDLNILIKKEAARAVLKGATALFVYSTTGMKDTLSFDERDSSSSLAIPVVYITNKGLKEYFSDHADMLDIELNVAFKDKYKTGRNVSGIIDNKAAHEVAIVTYYPSVNSSEGGLLSRQQAAYSAALTIEVAKMITSNGGSNNYAFYFVDSDKDVDGLKDVAKKAGNSWNYVINIDDITHTDSAWKVVLSDFASGSAFQDILNSLSVPGVNVDLQSTIHPNRTNTPFFEKGIPLITFSTASGTSGEKGAAPNTEKQLLLLKYIAGFIKAADLKGKQDFVSAAVPKVEAAKTGESIQTPSPEKQTIAIPTARTVIGLGIIPAKSLNKQGLEIKGVAPDKTGAKIGLRTGDLLLSLGGQPVSDMKSYLSALTKFRSGDKTILKIKRGKEYKQIEVVF